MNEANSGGALFLYPGVWDWCAMGVSVCVCIVGTCVQFSEVVFA